ncbi:MAG: thioredoxin family protein [Daejeonella sp.]
MANILLSLYLMVAPVWTTHFSEAQKTAVNENKYIILNFSGSDWCGPCIRTTNEIFKTQEFQNFSQDHLVLVNADFPRLKKNQLDKLQIKENDALADKFNPNGIFPLTLLLNNKGTVLKRWDGFPNTTPTGFINQIKLVIKSADL